MWFILYYFLAALVSSSKELFNFYLKVKGLDRCSRVNSMAKEINDLTTIDLFSDDKRPGRPKTNPNPRNVQIKINKRNQVKRDKSNGLKRVEFKIHHHLFQQLEELAKEYNVSRGELIESLLKAQLAK